MGSTDDDTLAYDDEKPQHTVYLAGYWIARTEVTNAMFASFVTETGYQTDAEREGAGWAYDSTARDWKSASGADWQHPHGPNSNLAGLDDHPVVQVSWNDALAYCQWAGCRLPTEAEWEKAARGTDGRIYPWGDEMVAVDLLNFADRNLDVGWADESANDGYQFTSPVGSYQAGASPYGLLDIAGNVWEWTSSRWGNDLETPEFGYPYDAMDGREDLTVIDRHVLRGGSWSHSDRNVRAAVRAGRSNDFRNDLIGFRPARSP